MEISSSRSATLVLGTAPRPADPRTGPGPWPAARPGQVAGRARRATAALTTAATATGTLATVAAGAAAMGAGRAPALYVLLGAGAVAAQLWQRWRRQVAVVTGALALVALNPVFGVAFPVLVGVLALCRHRTWPFFLLLVGGAIVLPKVAFSHYYHHPGLWNWINEPSLSLAIFASALWWRAREDARQEGGPPVRDDLTSFLLLFFLPADAAYPMSLSPRMLAKHEPRPAQDEREAAGEDARRDAQQDAQENTLDLLSIVRLLGWFVVKVAALWALRRWQPHGFLRDLKPDDVARLQRLDLWGVVLGSYAELYLSLAASADIPILVARLYGWSLPNPFRAALLAWNPVELWRRWGLYNRQLLLRLVYFPLGGSRRHRDRNILLTFVASALLLHSGWFGSKYATVGVGGWRDETLYFLLQGLAVCGCLRLQSATGARPGAPAAAGAPVAPTARPRWSLGRGLGTCGTQAWSAMVHVVVLAQGIDLLARARLVARCFGL